MRGFVAIFKRELLSLWVTPLAWILLTIFLLLQGSIFYAILLHFSAMPESDPDTGPMAAFLGQNSLLLTITLLLICPSLTMRSFAEEKRSQTIDILLASPASSAALVLGKYAAIVSTYVAFWIPTLLYAWVLRDSGQIELGSLLSGYLGVFLIGTSSLGLGVLMSALASQQIVALMLASSLEFGFFVLGLGEYIFESGFGQELGAYVSMTNLLDEMSRGIIDSRRIVLHASLAVWALFVTTTLVESWRSET